MGKRRVMVSFSEFLAILASFEGWQTAVLCARTGNAVASVAHRRLAKAMLWPQEPMARPRTVSKGLANGVAALEGSTNAEICGLW